MFRKIKFRVWDGNMECMLSWEEIQSEWESEGYFDSVFKFDHWIPMQFTGLKDRNNKEIYEGDIVAITDNSENTHYGHFIVEWDEKRAGFYYKYSKNDEDEDFNMLVTHNVTIIGNVYNK